MVEYLKPMKTNLFEDVAIIAGLIAVQFVYAGNSVLLSFLMAMGLQSLTIVIFSSFATFIILSPIAVYFERFLLSLCIFFSLSLVFIIR